MSGGAKSTDLLKRLIEPCMTQKARCSMRTSQKSITQVCRILICSLEARAASRSASQGAGELLRTIEETCFSTISKSLKSSDPSILLLKTFPICWEYRKGNAAELSLKRFQNWGIVCAGVCLTLPALEYRNPDEGCSLSDILEERGRSFQRFQQQSCESVPLCP